MAGLRAPIFEEKVVDFLLELAQVAERKVSREELIKDDDDEKTCRLTARPALLPCKGRRRPM